MKFQIYTNFYKYISRIVVVLTDRAFSLLTNIRVITLYRIGQGLCTVFFALIPVSKSKENLYDFLPQNSVIFLLCVVCLSSIILIIVPRFYRLCQVADFLYFLCRFVSYFLICFSNKLKTVHNNQNYLTIVKKSDNII